MVRVKTPEKIPFHSMGESLGEGEPQKSSLSLEGRGLG